YTTLFRSVRVCAFGRILSRWCCGVGSAGKCGTGSHSRPVPQFVLTCHFRTPVKGKRLVDGWLCSHSRGLSTSLIGLPCFVCGGVCVSNYVFQFGCCFPYLVLCVFVCPLVEEVQP